MYVLEIIFFKVISCYYDDPLVRHFRIKKTRELVVRKYIQPTFYRNIKAYVRGYDVCLASKTVHYKLYGNFQSLQVPTHCWKDIFIDFITGFLQLVDQKGNSYNTILVIVDRLTKMIYYKTVHTTINVSGLAEEIIDIVMRHHDLPELIISDCGSLITSKFQSPLCYIFAIKYKLSTAFYLQMDGQTKRQNSTIETYLQAIIN